jgi:replication fork clamp-binding protein CrfC
MTQAISQLNNPQNEHNNLYESDLNLWLEQTIAQLQAGDFHNLDTTNLIEELVGLAGRDRRELESRLERLLEHILKRCYVDLPDCDRGWVVTIMHQRSELKKILKQSPSLKRVFSEAFEEAFLTALSIVKTEYVQTKFPDTWQFSRDLDVLLKADFWENA